LELKLLMFQLVDLQVFALEMVVQIIAVQPVVGL
jgi:hypothetical protein